MALQHLCFPIVRQGAETMACWAASVAWYAKAVRNMNFTMGEISAMYKDRMAAPPAGKTIGGMGDSGRRHVFADPKWRLWQTSASRDDMKIGLIEMYLESSPAFIAYYDPKLGGAHMNVIVARVPLTETQLFIMDPDYDSYQIRSLQYYTEKSRLFHLASEKSVGF